MDSEGSWRAPIMQLLLIEAMLQFGMYLTRPIISSYAISLGASMATAGFLAGLLATAALIVRPVSGAISDRLSKRSLLVVSCGLFVISALGCALCQTLTLLGGFLALQGFAFAFKSTVVVSLASLIAPKQKIGTSVGLLGLAYTIACALGPAAGSAVAKAFGYSAVFTTSFLLLFTGFVLALLLRIKRDPSKKSKSSVIQPATNKPGNHHAVSTATKEVVIAQPLDKYLYLPAIPLALIAGLLMIAQGVTSSFILVVGEMRNLEGASLYFLFYSLATLAARPLAGKASDIFGVKAIAIPAMLVAIIGMTAAALIDSFAGIAIAGVSMGIGQGSAYCAIQAESVREVPENQLGRAANTFYIGPDLCMGLGPVAGGYILQAAGAESMFLFNAGAIIVALLLFIICAKNKARH